MDTNKYNGTILDKVSRYLNFCERAIDVEQVREVASCGVNNQRAVELLLANYLDLDEVGQRQYLPHMLKRLDTQDFENNEYYKNISFDKNSVGNWSLKRDFYAPYEIFVQDDFVFDMGKVLPQLGYFENQFEYPAVYQDGLLWMSVTPNEINTMRTPISKANGNVLTFGLGLGYFAYMCSIKDEVDSVSIVERDKCVIKLFEDVILPQFRHRQKINIINADAYEFLDAMQDGIYDYAFVDIYHDAGDGLEAYKKFSSKMGKFNKTKFDFWIEKTIKYYL